MSRPAPFNVRAGEARYFAVGLIAHTKDDQLASHEASQCAAERIPGARFVSLESGPRTPGT